MENKLDPQDPEWDKLDNLDYLIIGMAIFIALAILIGIVDALYNIFL